MVYFPSWRNKACLVITVKKKKKPPPPKIIKKTGHCAGKNEGNFFQI